MDKGVSGIRPGDLPGFMKRKYGSYLRFMIVGTVNTGIDFLIFVLLLRVGVNYLVAQAGSYGLGVVNSFLMNRAWTFANGGPALGSGAQFIRFVVVNITSLAISLAGLKILNYLGIDVYASKVMVLGITQFVSYLSYKYLVFGTKRTMKGCENL